MSTNKIITLIVFACIVAAAGIYGTAYLERQRAQESPSATSTPAAPSRKVAVASVPDGTYVARVHSILTSPEDTTFTFTPVEYVDGDEATSTAETDLGCDDQPIAACAPTLTRGYYVRESGQADFTAPLAADTEIVLRDDGTADISALKNLRRQFDPIFEVRIESGVVARITEKSPI